MEQLLFLSSFSISLFPTPSFSFIIYFFLPKTFFVPGPGNAEVKNVNSVPALTGAESLLGKTGIK